MRKLVFSIFISCALMSFGVKAQDIVLPIHDHSQKQFYNSSSEWIPFESQCHFTPESGLTDTMLGHTHVLLHFPAYAEIGKPIDLRLEIKTFMLRGRLDQNGPLIPAATNIVFDNSGTFVPGILRGDPNGLITQWATITIDPSKGWNPHGWMAQLVQMTTYFDNGGKGVCQGYFPVYSTFDLTKPESNMAPSPNGRFLATHSIYYAPSGEGLAVQALEFRGPLPILPINSKWKVPLALYTYGSSFQSELAPGRALFREDANLHMGIEGKTIFDVTTSASNPDPGSGPFFSDDNPYVIDPAVITLGSHSVLFGWQQTSKATEHFLPGLESWALLGVPISVSDVTNPPPPTDPCITDPLQAAVSVIGINHPVVSWTGVVTAKDDRSCTTTISR